MPATVTYRAGTLYIVTSITTTMTSLPENERMKTTPLLHRLQPATSAALQEIGVRRTWARRRCIFRTGDACTGIHLVLAGLVKLFRSNASGREQIVLLEGEGSVLSLAPLFDRGEQLATAETLKPTTTLFVAGDEFLRFIRAHPDARDAVESEMARRLRLAFGLLETIALKPVSARVATRVFELAMAHDALEGTQQFRVLLSQDEMAHVLATSRESVARALAELRAHGVIEQRGAHIRVLDARALFEWSNVTEEDPTATPLPAII
jgi:CRP/FNR family transcriptional regulator